MIGTAIANYRIDEKLGEGGMGMVYKATDLNLDRLVAIKVLSADLSRDPGLMERFRAEAKAQAHLNHANIASLYNLVIADGHTCIVMEYLEGETLDQMLRRRGLIPWQEAVPLFRQALLGIGFAHRMGIIHRDIKPSNIMINKYGVAKVMDFGIAKVLGGQRLTRTGTQVGTVAYMSPEQIRNRPVDIRSDIYCLGVTLYELLTAHLPFESDSEFQIMSDHVNTPPPPPTRHYPYIPHGIEQCILKALEKDPDARFQTVEEFGAALEHPDSIDQWVAEHAPRHAPPVLHTGGTPPPSSVSPFAATSAGSTPPPQATPPPAYSTPAPGSQTVVQTPQASTPSSPRSALWSKKNLPFILAGAAVLLLAVGIGAYELFKPKPVIRASSSVGSGTGNVPLSTALSTPQNPAASNPADSTNPSSSATPSSLDTSSLTKDTNPPATADASAQDMQNAQKALSSGRLFRPRTNSAFYWAKQAEQSGSPAAAGFEQTILDTGLRQVQSYREAKNFSAAIALASQIAEAYPDKANLRQLSASVQDEERQYQQQQLAAQQQADQVRQQQIQAQAQAEAAKQQQLENQKAEQLKQQIQNQQNQMQRQPSATGAVFVVQHRHIEFNERFNSMSSFCTGMLTVSPNGMIRYDCVQTQDRRCDHVTFAAGDIKQIKFNRQGGLHIATRKMGNWDFYGQPQQIQGAMQTISQLVEKAR